MGNIKFDGPWATRVSSFLALNKIAIGTYAKHAIGKKLDPRWNADMEIGVRFWRHQFTKAMTHPDIVKGREIFESLQTETDDTYAVTVKNSEDAKGSWYLPDAPKTGLTLLYLHGGGYTFGGAIAKRFASMLAHHCNINLYAPNYRLTPEHPHPAQAEDALAAWDYVTANTPAERICIIGDSAGGHMVLTLLQTLKAKGRQQPALCIGLCPWTDIGPRGESLHGNDPFDLVQGWMALRFGEWLDPDGAYGREALSPINHDFSGLAPLYLQAGGREILRDMIIEFAQVQAGHGADVMLDLWDDMPHDFQAYDSFRSSSREALDRICQAITAFTGKTRSLSAKAGVTKVRNGIFRDGP